MKKLHFDIETNCPSHATSQPNQPSQPTRRLPRSTASPRRLPSVTADEGGEVFLTGENGCEPPSGDKSGSRGGLNLDKTGWNRSLARGHRHGPQCLGEIHRAQWGTPRRV